MILVDSCVWIDALQDKKTPEVLFLKHITTSLAADTCLSHIVYFEVLRGISSDRERKKVKNILCELQFLDYVQSDFDELISIYRFCQSKGLTLSKLGDWLIFKTVLDHNVELLTSDKDFHRLNAVYPFKLVQFD